MAEVLMRQLHLTALQHVQIIDAASFEEQNPLIGWLHVHIGECI